MNRKTMMRKRVLRTGRTGFRSGLLLRAAVMGVCMTAMMPVQAASNVGSGGTVTYTDENGLNPSNEPYASGYVVHTFTATGTTNFTVPTVAGSLDIEYLLVGGGGSGGSGYGAGGGAGGLLTNAGNTPLTVMAGEHTVSVGSGGEGVANGLGNTGIVSSVFGLTALGGGGGGAVGNGGNGGSGGGSSIGGSGYRNGGVGTPAQGNNGGAVYYPSLYTGAGGGGAGAAGSASTGSNLGGAGGVGLQSSISGTTNWYAAGGSGYTNATSANAIGGKCQTGQAAGVGAINTGSGGGANTGTGSTSGAGGSGIVILRYRYVAEMPLLARVTAPANGRGFYVDIPVTATATVANAGAPCTVTFYTNFNGGAFSQAGEPDASEPYTLDLGKIPAGTYGVYAVATNVSETTTSPTNTFTVATDNVATGGTITYTDASGLNPRSSEPYNPGYVVHTFTTAGTNTLSIPGVADGLGIEYLVVGGGGSGGNGLGGGGGAGGLRTNLGVPLQTPAGSYVIVVGSGAAGVSVAGVGNPGGDSTAFGLKANGGGAGGGNGVKGGPGGSGGGGTSGATGYGGVGTFEQGKDGGTGAGNQAGGGGGGAGAAGSAATARYVGGAGGVGLQSSISGMMSYYAAGGSGYANVTSASGIGGKCQTSVQAGAGTANTGSGGGGFTGIGTYSGAGGSGIVIVRYPYVYVSGETVSLPAFSPPAGGFIGATNVTLSCMTVDAVIHYTTDGSTPTSESPVYSSAIEIPVGTNVTIKAIGVKDGYADSDIASATYYTGSSGTWTSTPGGSWPVVNNWLHGIVGQGRGVPVFFDTLTLAANTAVTLDGARTVGSLAFADIGDAYTWTLNTGSGGPLTLETAGTSEISVSNRTATMGVVLAGTNGLLKTGDGTLVLHEVNTFSGGVTVAEGTLDWQNVPNASAGTITVNAGATAKFHGTYLNYGYTVANALVGNGAITAKSGIGTGEPGNGSGYVTFSGDLSSFTGTLIFDTTLNHGVLSVPSDGSSAKWVVNRTGGSYYLSVGQAGTYKIGELSGNGALGAYYLGGTTTWEIGALGTDSTYDGVITNGVSLSGVAALRKVGTGKLTLTQASAYSGGTVVSNGVLEVGVNGSLGTNKVEVTGGKLVLLGSSAIHDSAQLYLPDGSDKLELATGVDETVRELYLNGKPAFQGKWGRVGSAWYQTPSITGDGILTVTEGPKGGTLISFF